MARLTDKLRLALAVHLIRVAALTTSATSVARVNGDHGYPCRLRFVFNKLPQLRERPIRMPVSLRLFNPRPRRHALEVFKGNAALRAFSHIDQSFADDVILMPLVALLLTTYLSQ